MLSGGDLSNVIRTNQGIQLEVHPIEEGISRTLRKYGVHEAASTDAFVRELSDLRTRVDPPVTVLDIGANIGYFTLLADQALAPDDRIIAFEPEAKNRDLLETNLRLNHASDRVEIVPKAVGNENRTVDVYLSNYSNRHTVREPEREGHADEYIVHDSSDDLGTFPVEQVTIDEFLRTREISPDRVNVVRMDLEGAEIDVLTAMKDVLRADGPLLLFVEVHPALSEDELETVFELLSEGGLEPVSAVADEFLFGLGIKPGTAWHGIPLTVDSFSQIEEIVKTTGHSIEVIARR